MVDLEEVKDKNQEEDIGISKRTRENLERKAPPMPQMIQTFKKGVQDM